MATAFTHARRVEIFRLLQTEPRRLMQLQAATRMSVRSLLRHLRKLEARGFIIYQGEKYSAVNHPESLGRMLGRLAANQ
jgi:predicted transcriptional regulator